MRGLGVWAFWVHGCEGSRRYVGFRSGVWECGIWGCVESMGSLDYMESTSVTVWGSGEICGVCGYLDFAVVYGIFTLKGCKFTTGNLNL